MSLKSQETIAQNQTKITFDVDHDTFEAAINKVFRNASKNITVPGFRKGKAPRSIIERMYGKGVFYEDAINEIIPEVYPKVIKEVKKTVVSRPEFDIVSIDENGAVISATFFTKPTVKIADYMGIEVNRPVFDVEDDDRVEVEAKLLPGDDFEQFLERATTAGQGHATVAEVGHGLLAGVHVGCLDELGEARVVPALLDHEGGNDARHLASCGQAGIG